MLKNPKILILLSFAAVYLIWGSTYLAIRIGVETIPPFLLVGVRFIIGGLIFYSWGKLIKAEKPTPKQWLTNSIVGILLLVGGTGLVSWAEVTVPSGLTALLIAMMPLWMVTIDWVRKGGVRPGKIVIFGLILGFLGVAALINPTDIGGLSEIDKFGAFLIVSATILWAGGSIYSRNADMPKSKIVSAGMQMITGGVGLLLVALLSGEITGLEPAGITTDSFLAFLYLTTIGTIGYGAFVYLLTATTPAKVATYAYVNPVIALILGNIIAGELISIWTISCSLFILFAVIIIITARQYGPSKIIKPIDIEKELVKIPVKKGA